MAIKGKNPIAAEKAGNKTLFPIDKNTDQHALFLYCFG